MNILCTFHISLSWVCYIGLSSKHESTSLKHLNQFCVTYSLTVPWPATSIISFVYIYMYIYLYIFEINLIS